MAVVAMKFSTSSAELLHVKSANLHEMLLFFKVQYGRPGLYQTFQKCFLRGSNVFLQWREPHFSCIVTGQIHLHSYHI